MLINCVIKVLTGSFSLCTDAFVLATSVEPEDFLLCNNKLLTQTVSNRFNKCGVRVEAASAYFPGHSEAKEAAVAQLPVKASCC